MKKILTAVIAASMLMPSMVLASGLKFGFVKTIPHMAGITVGHVLQLILVCFGLGKIFQLFPQIQFI